MKCPVCGSGARDIASNDPASLSIRCLVDGDYDLDAEGAHALGPLSPSERQGILSAAIRAKQPGHRPRITLATVIGVRRASEPAGEDVAASLAPLNLERS